jgi:excisionase family DNA binding protein
MAMGTELLGASSTEQLLTAREVASRLGATPRWVLSQWRAGSLPGFRLTGKMVRFSSTDVDAWLAARREGPKAV